jgi:hypothetical protein
VNIEDAIFRLFPGSSQLFVQASVQTPFSRYVRAFCPRGMCRALSSWPSLALVSRLFFLAYVLHTQNACRFDSFAPIAMIMKNRYLAFSFGTLQSALTGILICCMEKSRRFFHIFADQFHRHTRRGVAQEVPFYSRQYFTSGHYRTGLSGCRFPDFYRQFWRCLECRWSYYTQNCTRYGRTFVANSRCIFHARYGDPT